MSETSAKLHKIRAMRFMFSKIHINTIRNLLSTPITLGERKKRPNRDNFCLMMAFDRENGNNLCIRKMVR